MTKCENNGGEWNFVCGAHSFGKSDEMLIQGDSDSAYSLSDNVLKLCSLYLCLATK